MTNISIGLQDLWTDQYQPWTDDVKQPWMIIPEIPSMTASPTVFTTLWSIGFFPWLITSFPWMSMGVIAGTGVINSPSAVGMSGSQGTQTENTGSGVSNNPESVDIISVAQSPTLKTDAHITVTDISLTSLIQIPDSFGKGSIWKEVPGTTNAWNDIQKPTTNYNDISEGNTPWTQI